MLSVMTNFAGKANTEPYALKYQIVISVLQRIKFKSGLERG